MPAIMKRSASIEGRRITLPEMKCPVCDCVIDFAEAYDGDLDNEKREEEWYGRCPKCKKEYHWTAVFTFKEVKNFHEVKEDE